MPSADFALTSGNFQNHLRLPFNYTGDGRFSISSSFGPTGPAAGAGFQFFIDMVLVSNDSVLFYTNESTLLNASTNSFHGLLPFPNFGHPGADPLERMVFLPQVPSPELEFILQIVHNVSKNGLSSFPDVQILTRAIDRLPDYGISPSTYITPTSHLYQLMLSCAPLHPLEIYALAAQYGISSLAVTVSSHTLVVELSRVSDELSQKMGSLYLLRLFQLHSGRVETLKGLLAADPGLHNPTAECDFANQKKLKEKWNLAVASLLFMIRPDTTTTVIRDKITVCTSEVTCSECVRLRDNQLNKVLSGWSLARRTINL